MGIAFSVGMGVTIHFEGKLKRPEAYQTVLATARRFREEKDWDYVGPVKGVVLYPHENSEPVRLEFDSELYIQEYTKTQFAQIEVHLLLVELLKKIEPYFEQLIVFDEGEYLEQSDEYQGPVRLPSKRIVDVTEK